jgi:alpha-galactosidase
MPNNLQTPFMQFTINPDSGTWSLNGSHMETPSLEDVWMRVNYRMGLSSLLRTRKLKFQFLEKWYKPRISEVERVASNHGDLKQITVEMGPDVNGITYRIDFALAEQHPLFLWRLCIKNEGVRWIEIDKLEMLRAGFFPKRQILPNPGLLSVRNKTKPVGYGAVRPNPHPGDLRFFSNGWQSWSFSGSYGPEDVYSATQLGPFAANIWYMDGKTPGRKTGQFTSDMFGVIGDSTHRTGILVGFLSQKQHFGALDANISDPFYPAVQLRADGDLARLDPGEEMSTDWAVIQFVDIDHPDPLAPYLDAVAREHNVQTFLENSRSLTGWCSWYQFFEDIDERVIRSNLESAKDLQGSTPGSGQVIPLDIFQIDDGFEAQIGDWFDFDSGFPDGVATLATEIQASGFTPGLWLAPFIVHSRSKLVREKRDWLLRNRLWLPVNAGFIWNNFNKALDLTHPEALGYVREVVHRASQEWGFSYLKLDFLYAAAIKGRYQDRTKTRAQVLRMGLEAIREAVGSEVTLLGCGVPLGPAIGIFDAMRIGADVDPHWDPHLLSTRALFHSEPNLPSTRNALQNTFSRAPFHKRWWINDPDCLMIRPDSDLTLAEVESLATTIALTGGSLFFSDDLTKLPTERLRIAESLLPLIGKSSRVLDWFDASAPHLLRLDLNNQTGQWHLLAVFNWDDVPRDMNLSLVNVDLPPGDYYAREFWSGTTRRIVDGALELPGIPPHGVQLLSLRSLIPDQAHFLGSDLHISQGLEVTAWRPSLDNGIHLQLNRPGRVNGVIDLHLPGSPTIVNLNQEGVQWRLLDGRCYRFPVVFDQRAEIEIVWNNS